MKSKSIFTWLLIFLFVLIIIGIVSGITGRISNSRMIFRVIPGEVVEHYIPEFDTSLEK